MKSVILYEQDVGCGIWKKFKTEGRISAKVSAEQKRGVDEETRYRGNYLFYGRAENKQGGWAGEVSSYKGNFLVHT